MHFQFFMDSIPNLQVQGFNSQVEVPNSLSSLRDSSEPPDVGNWFSSYEYQTPDLDSNFSFEGSSFRRRDEDEEEEEANVEEIRAGDEVVVGEKVVQCSGTSCEDDIRIEERCLNKNLDSANSSLLFSEPPDIRNWFSSYNYESSGFDTSSLFRDEDSEENKDGDDRFDVGVMNEAETRSENVHPKGCIEHHSSSDKNMMVKQEQPSIRGDGSAEMNKNLTPADASYLEKTLQQCVQDQTLQHSPSPTKYAEKLNMNQGSLGSSAMRPPKLVQKNDTGEARLEAEVQHEKFDASSSSTKSFSARSSNCTTNKENDGFVTARKNSSTRANDENSWQKPEKILLQCSTNAGTVPLACDKRAVTKRKALAEATNLQQSNAEITGKWQCPQKRKPYVGPALKQLRLERWVRRV